MASTINSAHTQPAFRLQLVIVFLGRTTLNTAYRIVYPFLPSLARGLGISLQAASGLVSLRVVAGMAAPVLGPLGERYGRQRTMEFGLLIFVLAGLLLAGANLAATAAIAFVLFGLAKVMYDPAVYAYIGDVVPYQVRGRVIGMVELSWSFAWLFGVPLSGFLIEQFGWQAPWAAMAGLGAVVLLLTHLSLRAEPAPSIAARRSTESSATQLLSAVVVMWRSLLGRRPVAAVLVTSFLLSLAIEVPFIVYGAWLEAGFGLGLSALGLASIVVGLAEATAEVGTSLLADRLGKRRSVLLGLLGLAAALLLLPELSKLGLGAALASVVLMILTFEFALVSLLLLATEVAPDARATVLALNVTAQSLGHAVGALAGGWLWQWETITIHAATGAACSLLAALALARGLTDVSLLGP